jgi:DNA-binding MarR family transcriptional regulator
MVHSPKRKFFLDLVLSVFRLSGLLQAAGDKMAEGVGLTSARWKVIGVIALANGGVTVPAIGRALGQSRQAVQRITNVMKEDGLLCYQPNPRHQRSPLVMLTDQGQQVYNALRIVQDPWALQNTNELAVQDLETSLRVVRRLIHQME